MIHSSHLSTAYAVLEGFEYEAHKAPKDAKQIQTIAANALALLKEIPCSSQEKGQIEDIQKHILSKSKELQSRLALTSSPQSIEKKKESIRKDGHCLFRALGHGLCDLQTKSPSFQKRLETTLNKLKQTAHSPTASSQDKQLHKEFKTLVDLLVKPSPRKHSDDLVYALRSLCCTHNQIHHPDRAEGNPRTYFQKMRTTNAWGGSPEIEALRELLGIQIEVQTGKDLLIFPEKSDKIRLKYQNSHYDLIGSDVLE